MPDIRDNSTVKEIARIFTSNGRDKIKTLLEVGYSDNYAKCGKGTLLFTNPRVIDAIAKLDAVSAKNNVRTVQSIDSMQQVAYDLAIKLDQPSAAVSAGTAIARLYGLDKDTATQAPTPTLSAPEQARLDILARSMLRKA